MKRFTAAEIADVFQNKYREKQFLLGFSKIISARVRGRKTSCAFFHDAVSN